MSGSLKRRILNRRGRKQHSKHYTITATLSKAHSTRYCHHDVQRNPIWVRDDTEGLRVKKNANVAPAELPPHRQPAAAARRFL